MAKSPFKVGQEIQVHIERLSIGGRGVGRHEGLVVFVPDTAPDEDILVRLTLVKKNYAEGRITKIVKPSPARVSAPCRIAGLCGGCNWQHVSYPEQLKQKRALVQEALRKFSGFDPQQIAEKVTDTVPSPQEFRYRNRIQVHHDLGRVGFHKRGSHELIEFDDCLISEEALMGLVPSLKSKVANRTKGRVELYLTEEGQATVRRSKAFSAEEDEGPTGTAFSQVNTAQNENLVRYVVETFVNELADQTQPRLLDLYAGNGNFTFPLAIALPTATIASAELSSSSVEIARQKALSELPDQAHRLQIECQDVFEFLNKHSVLPSSAVLLDPPRTGCAPEVMNLLKEKSPAFIVYVSCHPVTLARDLHFLSSGVGPRYELVSVQPFDMFPQTDHVETVVVLRRTA